VDSQMRKSGLRGIGFALLSLVPDQGM
jgi:hypothetical protein